MPFLLIFTIFALLDFTVLFSVGSEIGLLPTVGLVLATGFIGLHLIRREGVATFARAQQRMANGEIPSSELLTGAALIFGGALLMAPGFLSDALGFMCLIPNARRLMGKLLGKVGIHMKGFYMSGSTEQPGPRGPDDWNQASGSSRSEDKPHQSSSAGNPDDPIEGEFISRDERRR
ncbi:FxsA family protein [Halomonas huangheensis]|uniref:Exlusion protein FxsA n=1 Tax=Halomonas huangheensis TaxID=1178482 RepID=W1NCF0_9GAMM|nr:FxsA family protein [Halomonas huangheensis]ALM52843.1 exlusion protein FxsA [Halomonas huangheensis]ERL53242.1 hypothetical protein BJB45_18380 [Halomonas huangheensis]